MTIIKFEGLFLQGETMKKKIKILTASLLATFSSIIIFNSLTMAEPVSESQIMQSSDGEFATQQNPASINPDSGLNPQYSVI